MRRIGALVVVAALGLGACTASGSGRASGQVADGPASSTSTTESRTSTTAAGPTDDSRAAYSVAWSDAYVDLGSDDRCLSGRLVDMLGVDQLNESGITASSFAADPVLDALGLDGAARKQLTADVVEAVTACNTADQLAKLWLASDDVDEDFTAFTECVAGPLAPELADLIIEGLADGQPDDVFDAVTDALEVADAACVELQVEESRRLITDGGPPLTDEERTCLTEEYQVLADEHRALSGEDHDAVGETCFEG